ncbi:uncharacterized protein K452DRAFT_282636 [Aplosporella prunicola CBS 121167]|uniref:Uncharacterized protein n=1 Tax=Aplosporella prunicola CBS 121167 TaxID=1176127 RepID=A0A6A6BRQ6_9PEZI|nr:uncharacterized protein K452DRAFT_282636 [Aplosporella prunicola CBS 121167]KAF2146468.1 hypothetical protein K452DRAFT_282636 [Aplosporella prunicola CBS 121167]
MMWAGFLVRYGLTNYIHMERDPESKKNGVIAKSYCDVLDKMLERSLDLDMRFVHDNSSLHTANLTK